MSRAVVVAAVAALLCAAGAHGQRSTPAAVYESIAPAVVYVETDGGSGSGLLLDGHLILTAAHVVYPHRAARVVFPDGVELLEVPLIGWDLLADIAVLGPVALESAPALPPFADADGLAIGSDLFVIGYPGEVESLPQPTLSRGILSRLRRWPDQGVTYLQTDASLDSGQSGGVLATEDGAVVGMTVFGDSFGSFGLAISADDVLPRVAALVAGEDPAGLGRRARVRPWQTLPIRTQLETHWSEQAFLIAALPDAEVSFEVRSRSDVAVTIVDGTGYVLAEADETERGAESISGRLDGAVPFLLVVEQYSSGPAQVTIDGSATLAQVVDRDDQVTLEAPAKWGGALDYPYDVDVYLLPLSAGESVRVRVDSVLVDPLVRVDYRYAGSEELIDDDDSGGGLFGLNAELVYRAEYVSTYLIVVDDPSGQMGGYTLSVEPAGDG